MIGLPQLDTPRLTVRLAQPGMEGALARFLADNFEGHLDRWSPPTKPPAAVAMVVACAAASPTFWTRTVMLPV